MDENFGVDKMTLKLNTNFSAVMREISNAVSDMSHLCTQMFTVRLRI